jgi:hypothetical protein
MDVIYVPQWLIEEFLNFLKGHIIEGDMTHKQMVMAINNFLDEINEAEVEVID